MLLAIPENNPEGALECKPEAASHLSGYPTNQDLTEGSDRRSLNLGWSRADIPMEPIQLAQQVNCTFCGKSQQDSKRLIASPDHRAYICDECTFEPRRLQLISEKSESRQIIAPSLSSRLIAFFRPGRNTPPTNEFRCSFCRNKPGSTSLYVPSSEAGTHPQICSDCLTVCNQILTDEGISASSVNTSDDTKAIRIHADFNGLFGELLCISHGESSSDDEGRPVTIRAGMKLTAFDEDQNEEGLRDDLIASGTVGPAPEWLRCTGSRWVLKIDEKGVRHESDLRKNPHKS